MWRPPERVERALAHQPVHAGLGAQQAEGVFALDLDGGALDAGGVAGGLVFHRGLEALALGVACRYWRSSMLAQSQASVPPAPAWMSTKQFSGSAGLLNMRRNSSCSMSAASLAASASMVSRPASSPSSLLMSNSSVLSASSRVRCVSVTTTPSSAFFSLPSSWARLGSFQTVGSSSAGVDGSQSFGFGIEVKDTPVKLRSWRSGP